jgi:hypothetical protein
VRLHDLILDLRKVQNEESRLLLFIWEHLREPTKEEKERMNWLMGEGEMVRILKRAEMSRYTNNKLIKGTDKDRAKYKKDLKKTLRDYDLNLYGEVYNVMTKHAHTIQEYGFLHPIIRIVCPMVLDSKYV